MFPTATGLGALGGCLLLAVLIGGKEYATTLLLVPCVLFIVYQDNAFPSAFILMFTIGIIAKVFDGFIHRIPEEALKDAMKQ